MSNPWLKFYPSDWRSDPRLRMCSLAARGLWLEMIAVMHESDPYGHLLVNGKPLSNKQLAALVGCSSDEVTTLLIELELAGVYSVTIDGVMFSRRMVRDREKSARAKENGSYGGNPDLKPEVNPEDKPEDKTQKPEARSQILEKELRSLFDELWSVYPKRQGSNPREPARKSFFSAVKSGIDPPILIAAAKKYAGSSDVGDPRFIPMTVTWLNQRRWEQYLPDPNDDDRWQKSVEDMAARGFVWDGPRVGGKWVKKAA